MNKLKWFLLLFFIVAAITYLLASLLEGHLSPAKWDTTARIVVAFIWFFQGMCLGMGITLEDKIKNDG